MKRFQLFLLALVATAAWLGLDVAFPAIVATGIPFALPASSSMASFCRAVATRPRGEHRHPAIAWEILAWTLAINGTFARTPRCRGPCPSRLSSHRRRAGLPDVLHARPAALDVTPASWLIGIQLYRVIGGTFLVFLARGVMPALFAVPAGIGDIAVGLLRAAHGARGVVRARPRPTGRASDGTSSVFTDLAVAITTGFLSTLGAPPNVQLGTFPTALVPATPSRRPSFSTYSRSGSCDA